MANETKSELKVNHYCQVDRNLSSFAPMYSACGKVSVGLDENGVPVNPKIQIQMY